MAHDLDTSALVKLVVAEAETAGLPAWLRAADRSPVWSDLARTELIRAVRRAAPDRVVRAHDVLDALVLVEVTTATFEAAARLDSSTALSPTTIGSATRG